MIDNIAEAISHAREVAKDRNETANNTPTVYGDYINSCRECAAEHEQLAEWLEELKARREADKWNIIHTEADLPKESDWYLVTRVFNSRKYVATVFFNENTKSFYEDSCTPLNNITHWRLLPKAPESEAEKALKKPQGDCISREDLKEAISKVVAEEIKEDEKWAVGLRYALTLIDNAEAIPLPSEQIAWEQGYEAGLAQGKQDALKGDLIRRSDALKAVDNRHEELLHDTEYRRKHCQIDLLGIKKHILAIPPADAIANTTEVRPQGEWEDYSVSFYKCPECGYLLNKDCPCCHNKVILPKGGAE